MKANTKKAKATTKAKATDPKLTAKLVPQSKAAKAKGKGTNPTPDLLQADAVNLRVRTWQDKLSDVYRTAAEKVGGIWPLFRAYGIEHAAGMDSVLVWDSVKRDALKLLPAEVQESIANTLHVYSSTIRAGIGSGGIKLWTPDVSFTGARALNAEAQKEKDDKAAAAEAAKGGNGKAGTPEAAAPSVKRNKEVQAARNSIAARLKDKDGLTDEAIRRTFVETGAGEELGPVLIHVYTAFRALFTAYKVDPAKAERFGAYVEGRIPDMWTDFLQMRPMPVPTATDNRPVAQPGPNATLTKAEQLAAKRKAA